MKRLIMLFAAVAFAGQAMAQEFKSGDLYYRITNNTEPYTVEVMGEPVYPTDDVLNNEYSELVSIVIPEKVIYNEIEYSVKSIGNYAFTHCRNLESVTIANSVTNIGDGAFNNCINLISIIIPDAITNIGNTAFGDCGKLTSLTIPNSVTSIGENAFSFVKNIYYSGAAEGSPWGALNLNAEPDVEGFIYSDTNKTKLTAYVGSKTDVTIPNTVTSIGEKSFYYCTNLKSVTMLNSIETIDDYAFYGCASLTSVTIPNSVENIGYGIFFECDKLEYNEYDNACYLGSAENPYVCLVRKKSDKITSCDINDNCKIILGAAFIDCMYIESVKIPNTVTFIGENAFRDCRGLESVTLPNSLTIIGNSVFEYCYSLSAINIPNSITSIGKYAFGSCDNLASIIIPKSVTIIDKMAFLDCDILTINIEADSKPDGWDVEWNYSGCPVVWGYKPTAVIESAANAVNIYACGKNIVVENATEEISVYDVMGKLICRDAINRSRTEIPVNTTGVYIVKVGDIAKRVVIN